MSDNRYLTFDEREQLRREMYEHAVFVAEHNRRMKELHKEARSLRWQIRWAKLRNFFRSR